MSVLSSSVASVDVSVCSGAVVFVRTIVIILGPNNLGFIDGILIDIAGIDIDVNIHIQPPSDWLDVIRGSYIWSRSRCLG